MMEDFYAAAEARKSERLRLIGDLSYRRFLAAQRIRDAEMEIEELDVAIIAHEEVVKEISHQQSNFNTWLAVKEGAITTDQLSDAIKAGGEDTGAIEGAEWPPQSELT